MATAAPQAIALVMDSLSNASEEHVEEIIKALRALPQCRKADAEALTMSANTPSGVTKSRSNKLSNQSKGPKRPLNSWMAFRKFYNKMLSPRTQKVKSKILTVLWQADPFEAKWSILAKSYSILRGNRDKKEVSLDLFLELAAPWVGVIPADIYLNIMGWELGEPNEQDQMSGPSITRVFTPELDSFPVAVATTTLSVDDLVKRCVDSKLFTLGDTDDDTDGATDQQVESLAMAVQPKPKQLPLGIETLRAGNLELEALGPDRNIAAFDPARNFQTAWNPAEFDTRFDDGGVWDSFNLDDDMITGVLSGQDVDFASFVNAEHFT